MRIFKTTACLFFLVFPAVASAQIGWTVPAGVNIIDVGARGTSVNGDAARYERYRDLRDGPFIEALRWEGKKKDWDLSVRGDHTWWRDQRYVASATRPGKMKTWFMWDQIPMVMSYTTRTLFVQDFGDEPGLMTIDPAIRAQIQSSASASPNYAAVPGLFNSNAQTFDTRGRRMIAQGGLEYLFNPELTFKALYQYMDRQAVIPYGGSFGHSQFVEFPAPIAHVTNDFDTNAEFVRGKWLFRAGYNGSWFHNDNTQAAFDNPFRSFDSPPSSGVSSSSSAGRVSLPPSNTFFTVNGLASVKLPKRSRASIYLSAGSLTDAGDPIMSQTINVNNSAIVQPLPRTTVNGEARTFSTNLTFVSRPTDLLDFSARFRSYDYDNRTPVFNMTQRVSYDNAPGNATMSSLGAQTIPGPVPTEAYGVGRQMLDLDARLTPKGATHMVAGVGYTYLGESRTHRFYEDVSDNVFRLTLDMIGNSWYTLRSKYEHAQRRGVEAHDAELELFNIGEQPGMRHFDIAPRNRDRVTVLGSVLPMANLAVNASVAVGRDDYLQSEFGLGKGKHHVYSAGADFTRDRSALGVSYSYENYNAVSYSRQANPPSPAITFDQYNQLVQGPTTVQVADQTRNWASDGTDRVHSLIFTYEINKLFEKADLHFTYDMNRSRAAYNYLTGPVADRTLPDESPVDTTLTNCNVPDNCKLPLVKNDLDRITADMTYWWTTKIGFGFSFWHERYRVVDWSLDTQSSGLLVNGGSSSQWMLLGYMYAPYTANTYWVRMLVKF